jgi:hypothetical protein
MPSNGRTRQINNLLNKKETSWYVLDLGVVETEVASARAGFEGKNEKVVIVVVRNDKKAMLSDKSNIVEFEFKLSIAITEKFNDYSKRSLSGNFK